MGHEVHSVLKVSTRDFSWGKGGLCVWLTTYHPCSAETSRKSGALTYLEPFGPPRPVAGDLYFTRCNRGFYCRSYWLLNIFRAPLCPSSGALEYYTGGCCLWYLVLWFSICWTGVEMRVMCPVSRMHYAHHQELKSIIQVVAACGIWCYVFQVVGLVWSWGLCVRFAGCYSILQTGHITLISTPVQQIENHSTKYHRQQPPV